jgi:hypothetical protein
LVDIGKGNGKRSPSTKQLFGTDMDGMVESAPQPLYFHLLEHLNDGEYFPSIMSPSFLHLKLGRQWKVIVFHMYFVKRRVRIFKTKNLYGNDT